MPIGAVEEVTPSSAYHRDVNAQLLAGLGTGLVFALVVAGGLGLWLVGLRSLGAEIGVGVGVWVGLRDGAAPSLLFTEIALRLRGRRVRFMPLLETALEKQVLRQAGAVYQFRHADLQDRLAAGYPK